MLRDANYFKDLGTKIGTKVDEKQRAYGDSVTKTDKILEVLLSDYKTDGQYVIPEELLSHMGLTVRVLDKINRIYSNPKGDLMGENPYLDIAGYGLLGHAMMDKPVTPEPQPEFSTPPMPMSCPNCGGCSYRKLENESFDYECNLCGNGWY